MELEDHVGDIIAKARKGLGINTNQAANAAELNLTNYSRLEEDGNLEPETNLSNLGKLLGLTSNKLSLIASGWRPDVDLLINENIQQISTNEGMEVHCYLVWDEESLDAALFDTGWRPEPILEILTKYNLHLKHLFITHTHHDHIAALTPIRKKFPNIELHSSSPNAPERQRNSAQKIIKVGNLNISSRETPGHADDGATYIIDNLKCPTPKMAIVGDAIFAGSMGGAHNHYELAREKVQSEILSLPKETILCPGHGPITTVGEQQLVNPFF
ncbi:MAG: MBL fold metallo-hydrolase [Verrucomicrobiota bacterium]|nr:MBL fold metallo-hydrolase [Verrucomicrobiota bacterium]